MKRYGTPGRGPWCGTAGGYTNHRCRCTECTKAWADSVRAARQRRHGEVAGGHPDGHPFTLSTYTNYGCRCEGCRAAMAAYYRRKRGAA